MILTGLFQLEMLHNPVSAGGRRCRVLGVPSIFPVCGQGREQPRAWYCCQELFPVRVFCPSFSGVNDYSCPGMDHHIQQQKYPDCT